MNFYAPNFAIGSSWRSAMTLLVSQFRKIKFAVESTFSFANYTPDLFWNGATANPVYIHHARYLRLNKLLFISVCVQATLGGAVTNLVGFSLPESLIGADVPIFQQGGCGLLIPGSGFEVGFWSLAGRADMMSLGRGPGGPLNYPAGAVIYSVNAFVEVS